MSDMIDRLHDLKSFEPDTQVTDSQASADVLRGRSALRQRRLRWTSAGAMTCVAAACVAGAVIGTRGGAAPARHTGQAATQHRTEHSIKIRLVSYSGDQEPGFTVATVPAGYVLQGAKQDVLDIAPASDHSSLDAFTGKLVVMLQSVDVQPDDSGTPVTINGHQGYLRHDDVATVLEYSDGTHDVIVQAWNNIALTDEQLVQFAEGVTVTAAVQAGRG